MTDGSGERIHSGEAPAAVCTVCTVSSKKNTVHFPGLAQARIGGDFEGSKGVFVYIFKINQNKYGTHQKPLLIRPYSL